MIISTQHLLPNNISPVPPPVQPTPVSELPAMEAMVDEGYGRPIFSVAPQTAMANDAEPRLGTFTGRTQSRFISLDARDFESGPSNANRTNPSVTQEKHRLPAEQVQQRRQIAETTFPAAKETDEGRSNKQQHPGRGSVAAGASIQFSCLMGVQLFKRKENKDHQEGAIGGTSRPLYPSVGTSSTYPGGLGIDIAFEAGKLPLDVAIFNSARAAGGDDKIRKYLQAVLVIGGTALVPGIAHALESRCVAVSEFSCSLRFRMLLFLLLLCTDHGTGLRTTLSVENWLSHDLRSSLVHLYDVSVHPCLSFEYPSQCLIL